MYAIILAAWMGKRLKELTKNNTKCMVKVNTETLIERMLHQIEKTNIKEIIMVVWYKWKELQNYIETLCIKTPIKYIENNVYDKTNNIYSLSLAKNYLCDDDSIIFESDIIFEDSVLKQLIEDPRENLALVDKYEPRMDWTCLKVWDNDQIQSFISWNKFQFNEVDSYFKTVNIYKFSKSFSTKYYVPFLNAYEQALWENEYYEQVLKVITMLDIPVIYAKKLNGEKWYEIDDIQDLDIAESIFHDDEDEKVELIENRYWWYWRYPKLLDFCYLVNPYFPPQKMMDEIKANMETLIRQYPSWLNVNSLLAAKIFWVSSENIVVWNWAAEIIKWLMENIDWKVWFIRPTFEEYPNRYNKQNSIYFISDKKDYSYDAEDIIKYFSDKKVNTLVIINPDNPTWNYIKKANILKILSWTKTNNIDLIIDESFIDFSDEQDCSLINQGILNEYKNLYIIKSISKSYWVPWLRLWILASWDTAMVKKLKSDVSIRNINSLAEFFMQIFDKYKREYTDSLIKLREERKRFQDELSKIKWIRVISSQANYIMIELDNKYNVKVLAKNLLIKHKILVKDLTGKTNWNNYLRIAVKDSEDNDSLIEALKTEI